MIKSILHGFLQFLYPPFCLHCDSPLEDQAKLLCLNCLLLMELINIDACCHYCFSQGVREGNICSGCKKEPPFWNKAAAALDYEGPAVSLITAMKYGNQPFLSKGLAGFMAAQFTALDWPLPDLIVPVPISLIRWLQRGYNQSWHLAEKLGNILQCPVGQPLRRRSGDFSQAGLTSKDRKALTVDSFSLSTRWNLEDKTLLLVDDVMTTGTTLKRCTEVLLEGFPKSIYILTVCRAIQ